MESKDRIQFRIDESGLQAGGSIEIVGGAIGRESGLVQADGDLCVTDCIRLMRLTGVRTAPVIDNGDLVGILTFTDILNSVCS